VPEIQCADLLAALPRRVKVGHYLYTVQVKELTSDAWGYCDVGSHIIEIDQSQTADRLLEVVLHEITHAISDVFGVRDKTTEEAAVTAFGKGWAAVLLDNPSVLPWLAQARAAAAALALPPAAPAPAPSAIKERKPRKKAKRSR
jgi:hypothetical protein